jgi:uncharacterized RDD family membrane protein YckC
MNISWFEGWNANTPKQQIMETQVLNPSPAVAIEYPSLSDRIQSTFIDTLFIIALMFVSASILERYNNAPDWIRIVLFFGLWAIYEPLCTTMGFTIGNYLKGIRVRKVSNTSNRINFIQAFFRYVLKISLGWISFLTIHSNNQKRAIHDLAVGSVMIKK